MKMTLILPLALVTMTSTAFAKNVDCTVKVNDALVFQAAVAIQHEDGEPEGSGSSLIYQNGKVRFYVTTYPTQIIGQVLTFNDVVYKTVTVGPVGQLVDFVSSSGQSAELSTTLEGNDYRVACKE